MPKEKRRNITGSSTRHAPLGQVIADDENRSKYATVRSRERQLDPSSKRRVLADGEEELLDEKSSQRIFELGREQLLEIEIEEQKEAEKRNRMKQNSRRKDNNDSSDEEDEMETGSIVGELADNEEE
jgi:hypothetical protein